MPDDCSSLKPVPSTRHREAPLGAVAGQGTRSEFMGVPWIAAPRSQWREAETPSSLAT